MSGNKEQSPLQHSPRPLSRSAHNHQTGSNNMDNGQKPTYRGVLDEDARALAKEFRAEMGLDGKGNKDDAWRAVTILARELADKRGGQR